MPYSTHGHWVGPAEDPMPESPSTPPLQCCGPGVCVRCAQESARAWAAAATAWADSEKKVCQGQGCTAVLSAGDPDLCERCDLHGVRKAEVINAELVEAWARACRGLMEAFQLYQLEMVAALQAASEKLEQENAAWKERLGG